jgi:hypothetical protein
MTMICELCGVSYRKIVNPPVCAFCWYIHTDDNDGECFSCYVSTQEEE